MAGSSPTAIGVRASAGASRQALALPQLSTLRIVTAARSRAPVARTLAAQLEPTRVQPGCRTCNLYQDVENPEAIILVGEWDSQAELDARLRSEECRAVLAVIELAQESPVLHFDTVTRRPGTGCQGTAIHGDTGTPDVSRSGRQTAQRHST